MLRESQRLGFLGARPVEQAAEHAAAFATALGPLADGARLIDLGSGGGLPGLVLADLLPRCSIVLVDRRQKRTDFLQRAIRRLGHEHVQVREADVFGVAQEAEVGTEPAFDAVTCTENDTPTCCAFGVYVGPVAPAIAARLPSHW